MMKKLDLLFASLGIAGGANWLSIAAGRYDLVARLTGKNKFGETNIATRTLYGVFGGAALWSLARLVQKEVV